MHPSQPTPTALQIGLLGEMPSDSGQAPATLATDLWNHLRLLDPILQQPEANSVGSCRGDRFQLQWWTASDAQHFALQALDTHLSQQWEAFYVPLTEQHSVAGLRTTWAAPPTSSQHCPLGSLWEGVFRPRLRPVTSDIRHPSFIDIVATAANSAGIAVVRDDHAQIDQLRSDVQYWSGLAKAQEKSVRRETAMRRYGPPGSTGSAPAPTEVQDSREWKLRDIDVWAAENDERIIILPRAISATKRSSYDDPKVLYQALELLANEFTQMKLGKLDRSAFTQRALETGVELRASVTPAIASSFGEQYFVRWGGSRRLLDQHLTKGVSRDPRYCLRIYFFFDEAAGKVVVGSMPSHLDTGAT